MFSILPTSPLVLDESEQVYKIGFVVPGLGHDPVIMPSDNMLHIRNLNKLIDQYCFVLAHDTIEHMEKIDIDGNLYWLDPYQSELVAHGIIAHNRPQDFRNLTGEVYQIVFNLLITGESITTVDRTLLGSELENFEGMREDCSSDLDFDEMISFLSGEFSGNFSNYIDYDSEDELNEILQDCFTMALEFYALGYLIAYECRFIGDRFYRVKDLFREAYSTIEALTIDGFDQYGAELTLSFTDDLATLSLSFTDTVGINESWDAMTEDLEYNPNDDDLTIQDKAIQLLELSTVVWTAEI